MKKVRMLQELSDVQLPQWSEEELRTHHYMLSDVSPWLNSQGVSLHHQVINELMNRELGPASQTEGV